MLDFTITTPVFPEQLVCKHGDARCNASRFLRSVSADKKANTLNSFFAYGNEGEVVVCRGKQAKPKSQTSIGLAADAQDAWHQVHSIFEQNGHRFIFGFLGYGFGLVAGTAGNDEFPAYWFGTADLAIRFGTNKWEILHGDDVALDKLIKQTVACACQQKNLQLAVTLDQSDDADYLEQVEKALAWVQQDASRRMTVARRVPLPSVDLLDTFHCQPSHNTLSRSFYLDIGTAAFVGKCPEVLLDWTPGKFNSYKLSGTYPKDKNPESDKELVEQFLADGKIISEHQLSADGFGACIAKVGAVSRQGPSILNLDRLRHMMTTFTVNTDPKTPIAECLRAVLPAGVSPTAEGVPALLAIEKGKRGPYYGLVGLYAPSGKASFTQILRSVFKQDENYYSWVGAAVTNGSSAKGELEESKLKLSDIVVALR